MSVTEQEIKKSKITKQLWSILVPSEKNGFGIIQFKKKFNKLNNSIEKLAEITEKTEVSYIEDRVNFGVDLNIISITPNLYLFLEAIYEKLDDEIKDFHYEVCENIKNYIHNKEILLAYPSISRVDDFEWRSNSEGYVITQNGKLHIQFDDILMAKFVSIVCSEFSKITKLMKGYNNAAEEISDLLGQPVFTPTGHFIIYNPKNKKTEYSEEEKKGYLKAKKILKEMNWNIHEDFFNINEDLKKLYKK